MKYIILISMLLAAAIPVRAQINTSADTPLRVIAIFAHPDERKLQSREVVYRLKC